MAPGERSEIVQILEDSRKVFTDAAAGVSEAQAKTNPAEGRWSVLQCVEHVTIVEERFLGFLESAGRLDSPAIDAKKEAELLALVADRSARAQAPEPVQPTGRYPTLAEAMQGFNAVRGRTIAFATGRAGDLHTLACEHRRFGPLNGREMLVVIAAHARRHAEQMREVHAAL
ncbi:MAG TPA: DinB family protein [Bryobacteraceae bacterium]|nr:DinB family protein [Bryobacteraceae bacterium]